MIISMKNSNDTIWNRTSDQLPWPPAGDTRHNEYVFSIRSLATPIKLRLRSFEQYYIGNIKKDLKNKLDEGRGVQSGFNWLKKGQTAGSLEQRNRPHTSTN